MMRIRTRSEWTDVTPRIRTAGREALFDVLEYLLDESNKIVPHDKGDLQASGQVSIDPNKLIGSVSYNTPYAIRLHEHPEYKFQKGRQGKWLEKTFKAKKSKVQQYMRDRIASALE